MKKNCYANLIPYTFEEERKGAKYCINGKYANAGEFAESVVKFHLGIDYIKNPSIKYNEGSDIESLHASIKSSGASLAAIYGDNIQDILDIYFANVASTVWIYVSIIKNQVTEYHMNAKEFRLFVEKFGVLKTESSKKHREGYKVRLKAENKAMLAWLECQAC